MKIKEILTNNKIERQPIILLDEFEKDKSTNSKSIELKGVLTSNLRSRKSTDIPAMAFFRTDENNNKHSLSECQQSQCKSCEIPVIFRLSSQSKVNLIKGKRALLKGKPSTLFCLLFLSNS
jgi:hypothetical protein